MFFALSSFAIDTANKDNNKQSEFEITKSNFELTDNADFVIVVCSVNIRNRETCETRKVVHMGIVEVHVHRMLLLMQMPWLKS